MPQLRMSAAAGVALLIDYTNAGRVTGFTCANTSGQNAWGLATLSDGRTFGQSFTQGSTSVSFPANTVTVAFDGSGEPSWVGLAGIAMRVPA